MLVESLIWVSLVGHDKGSGKANFQRKGVCWRLPAYSYPRIKLVIIPPYCKLKPHPGNVPCDGDRRIKACIIFTSNDVNFRFIFPTIRIVSLTQLLSVKCACKPHQFPLPLFSKMITGRRNWPHTSIWVQCTRIFSSSLSLLFDSFKAFNSVLKHMH